MKKIFYLLLLSCLWATAQTGPTRTINGREIYNYAPSAVNQSKFAALDSNNQMVFQAGKLLTASEYTQLQALLYVNNTSTFTVAPTFGERGISTALTLTYTISSNSDVFTSASINQGIGAASFDSGTEVVSGGSKSVSTTYTLTKNFTRNGTPTTETQNATYSAYTPQWSGVSSATDFTDSYSTINTEAGFTKYIQSSAASISKSFTTSGTYPWFIVSVGTGIIKDGNGFSYTIGTWGDEGTYWWRKSLTLTLNDSSTATVWLIRARETSNLTAFTFIHSNN